LKTREDMIAEEKKGLSIEVLEKDLKTRVVSEPNAPIPTVQNLVGRSLNRIGAYGELNNKQQVVAVIDEVFAIHFESARVVHHSDSLIDTDIHL